MAQVVNSSLFDSWEDQEKQLPEEIFNAIICVNGELTDNFKYIADLREVNEKVKN